MDSTRHKASNLNQGQLPRWLTRGPFHRQADRHAFVMDARLIEARIEEFAGSIRKSRNGSVSGAAVNVDVEHIHENAEPGPRVIAQAQLFGRRKNAYGQQLAICRRYDKPWP